MLYIVPTPIGNLRDITLRAIDVLKAADFIVCEDTRRTHKLLITYEIDKPLFSFHDHSSPEKLKALIGKLKENQTIALVSDAGTPLISDPGFDLVHEAIRHDIKIEALPGPSAILTALVASGLAVDAFSFFGFLPQKSAARKKVFLHLKDREETLIFYESPYRVLKVLEEMKEIFGDREAAVARELTKKFEEISRGHLSEIVKKYASRSLLGEFVILVSGKDRKKLFSDEK